MLRLRDKKKKKKTTVGERMETATKNLRCSRCKGKINFADARIAEHIAGKKSSPVVLKHSCLGDGRHVVRSAGQQWTVV